MSFYMGQRLLQYQIMQEVAIVSDTLNFDLPVGEKGYITNLDQSINTAYNYTVRVPSKKLAYYVPECDLMDWSRYLGESIHNAIHGHYVNEALVTGNKELFKQHSKEIIRHD